MIEIGSIVNGKYKVLEKIGDGGMSTVYLAKDTNLDKKLWALKEMKGSSEINEINKNSLLTDANIMTKLDHPSFPRIVDIIKNATTIYIVMDYIQGESLDKILAKEGVQSEKDVLEWAKQMCDALRHLHKQNPPIVYRDMKPDNVMLNPEGKIRIIDFGVAIEDKGQKKVAPLGTKGYAPPEQCEGKVDIRSDIFALGMTMHYLLTGVHPQRKEPYKSVREWNPELSEGIEKVIDRCVEENVEDRYQNCSELLYDLENYEKLGKAFEKKQKKKLMTFILSAAISVIALISGVSLGFASTQTNNQDYEANLRGNNIEDHFLAVEIYPERVEAYNKLIEDCKTNAEDENISSAVVNEQISKVGNTILKHKEDLDFTNAEIADMYYDMGKLYFSDYEGSFKSKAVSAQEFFEAAIDEETADFDKKEIAECYNSICEFMINQSTTSEHTLDDYTELFEKIERAMSIVDAATDSESKYDKISLYYVAMLLINDQAEYMAGVEFDRQNVLDMMEKLEQKANGITSALSYVNNLKDKIQSSYGSFVDNINGKYDEVEKRRQGGNES